MPVVRARERDFVVFGVADGVDHHASPAPIVPYSVRGEVHQDSLQHAGVDEDIGPVPLGRADLELPVVSRKGQVGCNRGE